MKFPCWDHSRVIPFECFLPPTTTTPCFSLSVHLSEYFLHITRQLPSNSESYQKNHTCARNHRVFQGQSKQSRPPQSAGNCITEMSSRSDVDLMPWACVGWAPSTDYSLCQQGDSHTPPCYSTQAHCWLFSGIVNCHETLAQWKGKQSKLE